MGLQGRQKLGQAPGALTWTKAGTGSLSWALYRPRGGDRVGRGGVGWGVRAGGQPPGHFLVTRAFTCFLIG